MITNIYDLNKFSSPVSGDYFLLYLRESALALARKGDLRRGFNLTTKFRRKLTKNGRHPLSTLVRR